MSENPGSKLEQYRERSGEWPPYGQRQVVPSVLWVASDRRLSLSDTRWLRQAARMDVCIASSSEEAATLARGRAFAFCVIEFELKDDDGVQVLEHLRARGLSSPAVLLTAAPELALQALAKSPLAEVLPVFSRSERFERLREWLDQLETCALVSCF